MRGRAGSCCTDSLLENLAICGIRSTSALLGLAGVRAPVREVHRMFRNVAQRLLQSIFPPLNRVPRQLTISKAVQCSFLSDLAS